MPTLGHGWHEEADCRPGNGHDPELWWPATTDHPDIPYAKSVCLGCRVRVQCRAYADDNDIREGIWGGATASERGIMRQAAARKARRQAKRARAAMQAEEKPPPKPRKPTKQMSPEAMAYAKKVLDEARALEAKTQREPDNITRERLNRLWGLKWQGTRRQSGE